MTRLEQIYCLITEQSADGDKALADELESAIKAADWPEKEREILSDAMHDGGYIGRKYGFMQGFRFAVGVMLECLI